MNKLISLITCLLYTCLLTGCGDTAAVGVAASPPAGETYLMEPEFVSSEEVLLSPADAGITYRMETEILESENVSKEQVKLTASHYELPVLQALRANGDVITEARDPAEEQALLVVNTFNGNFDVWRVQDDSVAEMAQKDYETRPEMFVENGMYYQDEMTYTVYTTDRLVSVQASSYSYYGGAHPNSVSMAWNFDLEDGAFLNPSAIALDEPEFESAVAAELIRQAQLRAQEAGADPEDFYWEDYADILTDWTSYTVSFSQSGMIVSYSPYELGCYASGAHAFTVSNHFLKPFLSEYGLELLGLDADS